MIRRHRHTHPCAKAGIGCTHQLPCDGTWERNFDGWPSAICDLYHLPGGQIDAVACEDCQASVCFDCGAVIRLEGHSRDCLQVAFQAGAGA